MPAGCWPRARVAGVVIGPPSQSDRSCAADCRCATLAPSFKPGTAMPERSRMQTAAQTRIETPAAGSRPASLPSPGLLALEGGTVHRGQLRGAPVAAEGDLIFTTRSHRLGRDPDRSQLRRPDRRPHPPDGGLLPHRPDRARVDPRPRARPDRSRLVTPPAGPGRSLEELLIEAGVPAIAGVDTRAITLELRRGAARRAVIRDGEHSDRAAVAAARRSPTWDSVDHVAAVATSRAFTVPAVGSAPDSGGPRRLRRQALAPRRARRAWASSCG